MGNRGVLATGEGSAHVRRDRRGGKGVEKTPSYQGGEDEKKKGHFPRRLIFVAPKKKNKSGVNLPEQDFNSLTVNLSGGGSLQIFLKLDRGVRDRTRKRRRSRLVKGRLNQASRR